MYTTKTSETSNNGLVLVPMNHDAYVGDDLEQIYLDSSNGWFKHRTFIMNQNHTNYHLLGRNSINPYYTISEGKHFVWGASYQYHHSIVVFRINGSFNFKGNTLTLDKPVKLGRIVSEEGEHVDDYILTSLEIVDGIGVESSGSKTLKFINQYGY